VEAKHKGLPGDPVLRGDAYDASLEWHRDKYLMAVQSAASGGSIYQAAQGQLDASAQINLTDRIRLVLEGVNLDRTTAKQYLQYPGRLYTTLREDRRVFFGVAATF
jgi:hypothetical protein